LAIARGFRAVSVLLRFPSMREIPVVLCREEADWVAQALSVDVSSFGSSPEEALAMIREALELFFEDEEDVQVREVLDPHLATVVVQASLEF
jgi:predicted RNase H-like HicB family nuclease